MRMFLVICLQLLAIPSAAVEDGPQPAWAEVKSLLRQRCVECHGPIKPEAGLNLSNAAAASLGGENGPPVIPGDPDASLIWQRIVDGEMPPEEPLPADEQALLRNWIGGGAPGLLDPDDPATQLEAVHWSFRPLAEPAALEVGGGGAVRTSIDHFVRARLQGAGLSLSDAADRTTLIRRVSFDLTGLPPTPEEITAFQNDTVPDAYARMVDGYLASQHYGARWGKYWLDAAGYADSNGYFAADSDRPNAYRYRDWVIRSFNEDKPYDQFVREQLSGDELVGYALGDDVTDEEIAALTATHFLRNAPDGTGESDGNPDEVRIDRYTVLEGNLEIMMNCLLGVTIQCARCHDHKFEPVTQREYYSLQAIFYGAYNPESWTKPNDRYVEVGTQTERELHHARIAEIDEQNKALQDLLNTAAMPFRREFIRGELHELKRAEVNAILAAWETLEQDRNEQQQALVESHQEVLEVSDEDLVKQSDGFAKVEQHFQAQIAQLEQTRPAALPKIALLVDTDKQPADHHVLVQGQHHQPGDVVPPDVPAAFVLGDNSYQLDPARSPTSPGRRLAFARWVSSTDNPLFARAMVNRIWMHHFGNGLVTTSANLGISGAPPSHPKLLDYLAVRFIESGWSVKELHRLILGSAVYRQQSVPRDEGLDRDPDNRLWWRFPLRRLSAEAVRDATLAISGLLDEKMYGPYIPTERRKNGLVSVVNNHPGARRRSVFLQQRRTQMLSMLELFDAPVMLNSCPQRSTSTVPLQSLAMLNSDFVRDCARAFALRLQERSGTDDAGRIDQSFLMVAGRPPLSEERRVSEEFLVRQREVYTGAEDTERRVWVDYCQMLLAGTAALYIE